jgi:hypothetical protein
LVTWITSTPNNSVSLTFTAPVGYTSTACTLALTVKLGTLVDFNLKVNNAGVTTTYDSSNGLNTSTWTTIYYQFTTPAATTIVMAVQLTSNTANNFGTMYVANLQIYAGTGTAPIATVLTGSLAVPYGDLHVSNIKVNDLPSVVAFACAFIANNGTVSVSNTRGVTITAARNTVGVVTLTLASAHPAGALYTINAIAYVASLSANPTICSVVKLPTTCTSFRTLTKDCTNTAVDCDFLVSVI